MKRFVCILAIAYLTLAALFSVSLVISFRNYRYSDVKPWEYAGITIEEYYDLDIEQRQEIKDKMFW